MKKFLSFLYRFAFSIIVVIYLIVAPNFVMKKLLQQQNNINGNQTTLSSGVIDMWHIESFEGGSASRSSWLLKRAQEFEKQNKGVFISITNISLETAKLNLQKGKKPSLISFSLGLGDELKNNLLEYSGNKLGLEQLVLGGKINNKQLAVPYMLGGYCMFSKKNSQIVENATSNASLNNSKHNKNLIIAGLNNSSLTSVALTMFLSSNTNNISKTSEVIENSYNIDSYKAYDGFIKGKADCIFGTQRDFYRINNRINNGSMEEGEFKYCSFTDLVQYIGICKGVSEEVYNLSQKFIEYLTSSKVQSTIKEINMFSVQENSGKSDNEKYDAFENYLKQNLKTVNVFLPLNNVLELKRDAQTILKNNEKLSNKISKYII